MGKGVECQAITPGRVRRIYVGQKPANIEGQQIPGTQGPRMPLQPGSCNAIDSHKELALP